MKPAARSGCSHLILGGARSGKSAFAARLAEASRLPVVFIATAVAMDGEMEARILRHRQDRPTSWHLVEEPIALAGALAEYAAPDRFVVVDCLTLWLSNLLLGPQRGDEIFWHQRQSLLEIIPRLRGSVVLVSNETGLGVVPMGAITRRFVDECGLLHQQMAATCDRVSLVVAGLPVVLKGVAA